MRNEKIIKLLYLYAVMILHLDASGAYTFSANNPEPERTEELRQQGRELLEANLREEPVVFYDGRLGRKIVPIIIAGMEACIAAFSLGVNRIPAIREQDEDSAIPLYSSDEIKRLN